MSNENAISPVEAANKEFMRPLVRAINFGWAGIFFGQLCRNFKDSAGELLFPQIFRHHLSNVFDGAVCAGVIDELQMFAQERRNKKNGVIKPVVSHPILCASFALIAGVGYEAATPLVAPNRHFDVTDASMHAVSAGAYAVFGVRRKKKFERRVSQLGLKK